jgi:hypothetical protein
MSGAAPFLLEVMMFWLMNMVRKAATRMDRVTAPQRHRLKHHVCGGSIRLVRSRPQPITEEQLRAHYDELYDLQQRGILQVREITVEGRLHVFDAALVEKCRTAKRDRQTLTLRRAQLVREGRLDEARALASKALTIDQEVTMMVEDNGARDIQEAVDADLLEELVEEVIEEVAEVKAVEPEEPEAVAQEPEPEPEPVRAVPKPDFSKMNKAALLDWLYTNTGAEDGKYDSFSKKQLLKIAEDL